MTNPVAQIRVIHSDGKPAYKEIFVYCPACEMVHPFTIEVFNGFTRGGKPLPVWGWNGNLEKPTFTPSMLAYSTVHLCAGEHAPVKVCDRDFEDCGHRGHGYVWVNDETGEQGFFKVHDEPTEGWTKHTYAGGDQDPHPRSPAWGNCHSFLVDGVWQFLPDCAHRMAGTNVPMVPLPDWWVRE